VGQLEREAEGRERLLEEARGDKRRLQRQVDSISEQVDTCKLHIQKLTLSKETHEAERQNLFTLIEEQKMAITKLEKETLSLKASRYHNNNTHPAEREDSLDSETCELSNANVNSYSLNAFNNHHGNHRGANIEEQTSLSSGTAAANVVSGEEHVSAFQQHVESVRANVQIALTRYLEAVHLFQSHGNKDGFMLETKHILTHGKECLDQIQQLAEKYVILPSKTSCKSLLSLNEKLIQQNRELTDIVSLLTNERIALQRKLDESHMKVNTSQSSELQLQKVYSSFLRADSRRKNLLYQKRYLLLLIEGFRSYEDSALRMISEMGLLPADTFSTDLTTGSLLCRNVQITPYRRFKGAVRSVMAVWRMRQLVNKWKHICNPTVPKHIPPHLLSSSASPAAGNQFSPKMTNHNSHSMSSLTNVAASNQEDSRRTNNSQTTQRVMCGNGRPWNVKHGHQSSSEQPPAQSMAESVALSNISRSTYTKGHAINNNKANSSSPRQNTMDKKAADRQNNQQLQQQR